MQGRRAGVEAGDLHQVVHQAGELHGFLADEPYGRGARTARAPRPRRPLELRETARDWQHRVEIHTAKTDHRPADAFLIRPDAHIAWASITDEPADTAVLTLRDALFRWFGTP
ncbi:hypothetical protein HEP84_49395 [Streptomyces sp. RLB1-33]